MSNDSRRIVERFYEEFVNRGDYGGAEQFVADECVFYFAGVEVGRGPEAFRQMLRTLRTGFPDFKTTIEDVIVEDDKVAERVTSRGTHNGEFQGVAPTGKSVTMAGISMFRIADGKIVENWAMPDQLGLLQQLGALPAQTA